MRRQLVERSVVDGNFPIRATPSTPPPGDGSFGGIQCDAAERSASLSGEAAVTSRDGVNQRTRQHDDAENLLQQLKS